MSESSVKTAISNENIPEPVTRDGVTLRFIQWGEFEMSLVQGAEIEIVNASDNPVVCELTLVLRQSPSPSVVQTPRGEDAEKLLEVQRIAIPKYALFPHSRRGWRVVEPLTAGECVVDYEVKLNGQSWFKKQARFSSGGPYRISLRPFFLGRGGIFIIVEALNRRVARFRASLLEPASKKVLFQTEDFLPLPDERARGDEPRRILFSSFLAMRDLAPGEYSLQLEVFSPPGADSKPEQRAATMRSVYRHS